MICIKDIFLQTNIEYSINDYIELYKYFINYYYLLDLNDAKAQQLTSHKNLSQNFFSVLNMQLCNTRMKE